MNLNRKVKKVLWYIDAWIAQKQYPLNKKLTYIGVTGTDGKTTTCSFIYEIARELGYNPLLITTVGAKFEGKEFRLNIKPMTFISYSFKRTFENLKKGKLLQALKAFILQDKNGYDNMKEEHRTTPLASEIRKTMIEYEKKGANLFILEISSHAIDQYRVLGIEFDSVGFTNITNEHLDYHSTWENYASTKSKLINMVKEGGSVALNESDQKSFNFLINKFKEVNKYKKLRLIKYKVDDIGSINPNKFLIKVEDNGSTEISAHSLQDLEMNKKYFLSRINIYGKYNVFNALAAFSVFYGFDKKNPENIAKSLSNLKNVAGRMNIIHENPKVIIDYAHTPNAMLNVLPYIDKGNGKLWVIFGCAGERDKYKRPEMGRIAFDYADNILITVEDPRKESQYDINNQIISGFKGSDKRFTIYTYYPELKYQKDTEKFVLRFDEPSPNSRRNAIKFAIENASPEDIIMILGKGHETSIMIGETDFEWSDEKVAKEYLNQ